MIARAYRGRGWRGPRAVLGVVLVAALAATGCSRPEPEPAPTVTVTPTPTPARTAAPTPMPTPEARDPFGEGPATILLIGTDSRDPADLTGNADTILVVHLPEDREQVYLVSFTRDMWVRIPGLGEGKINSAFSRAGTDALVSTVEALLEGTEIDHVVQSNFAGFIALTRALGGFEVENTHASTVTVQSTGRVVHFPEGRIRLENTDGLIYVRERKRLPLGDLDRTERQRAALVGMLEAVKEHLATGTPAEHLELVQMLHRNVKVTGGLEPADMLAMAPLLEEIDPDDVVSLMAPITGFGTRGGASVNLVDTAQMAALGEAMRTDTMDAYVAEYGTAYAP